MLFSIPFVANVFRNIVENEPLDLTLLVVAAVTCILGSTMQISHKNLDQKKKHKPLIYKTEVLAIYITGIVIGMIAYMIGHKHKEIVYTMLIGVFGSYMSLDLFHGLRVAMIALLKKLPDAIIQYYLNIKDQSKDPDEK